MFRSAQHDISRFVKRLCYGHILHKTRSIAIENFNEHFKAIFDIHGAVPTKGLVATQRFVLSAVFVYQLAILYSFLYNLDFRTGLKALSKAA
jgi:hypothetical protein